jgi:CRISPR-associated protein Csb2
MIIAPAGRQASTPYRLYVPNNAADLVAAAWARGTSDASIADHRVKKDVQPTWLIGGNVVHYLWLLTDLPRPEVTEMIETLSAAARSITHLGWGVDMAAGNASLLSAEQEAKLSGERWRPVEDSLAPHYRVPIAGTLDALIQKHQAFLDRLGPDGFAPVPPLTDFGTIGYRRDTDTDRRPFAAFEIWKPVHELAELPAGKSKFRPFDPVSRTVAVAGMVRHATAELAARMRPFDWTDQHINTFVHGHTPDGTDRLRGGPDVRRFAYLPLPSVELRGKPGGRRSRHVGSIRRVLVVGPPDGAAEVAWARRALSGRELIDHPTGQAAALLSVVPDTDAALAPYLGANDGVATWSTVTPVVLPGRGARGEADTERLLRTALRQAGLPPTLAAHAALDWRVAGFLPGVDLATRYALPAHQTGCPRYHVRVRWRDGGGRPVRVRGPVAVGAVRYSGLGLFVADE